MSCSCSSRPGGELGATDEDVSDDGNQWRRVQESTRTRSVAADPLREVTGSDVGHSVARCWISAETLATV
jgi:hypothetical protein